MKIKLPKSLIKPGLFHWFHTNRNSSEVEQLQIAYKTWAFQAIWNVAKIHVRKSLIKPGLFYWFCNNTNPWTREPLAIAYKTWAFHAIGNDTEINVSQIACITGLFHEFWCVQCHHTMVQHGNRLKTISKLGYFGTLKEMWKMQPPESLINPGLFGRLLRRSQNMKKRNLEIYWKAL